MTVTDGTAHENPFVSDDWATDYDVFDPTFVDDPYLVYRTLRDDCPIAHTERHGGSFLPTTYRDIYDISHDVDTFSSAQMLIIPTPPLPPNDPFEGVHAPPISSDPPEHLWARKLILPFFSPRSVAKYEAGTRELCNTLIDRFIDTGHADIGTNYAQQIPVRVIAAMLNIDASRSDEFVGWVRVILEQGHLDRERRLAARTSLLSMFQEKIAERREHPLPDDLITELIDARIDGEPVPEKHILGTLNLMLVAGIDTTWSSIGSALWHFAHHPSDRALLREQPELWPMAIEELLRAYAPVSMARVVVADTEVNGCPMKKGDKVILPFPAANRDPLQFENPDQVDLTREVNRHVAFGSGIHRCAGSNLARLELRVAVQTFLERIPEFELVDPSAVTWAGGQVHGPRVCEVSFPVAG